MSIRKRKQTRDVAVRMGPGEFVDPHDLPHIIPWKRILDVAAEELSNFIPSLLGATDALRVEEHLAEWLKDWNLPVDGYEGSIVSKICHDTMLYNLRALRNDPNHRPAMYAHPIYLRPNDGYEAAWTLNGTVHRVFSSAMAAEVDKVLTDDDGSSVLGWNPYHETRQEVSERLHRYLDMALDEIERRYLYPASLSPDGLLYGQTRTPELPRRHLVWFVRWKFRREKIYGIAKSDRVTENAVRKAVDGVASVLGWGYRNGSGGKLEDAPQVTHN